MQLDARLQSVLLRAKRVELALAKCRGYALQDTFARRARTFEELCNHLGCATDDLADLGTGLSCVYRKAGRRLLVRYVVAPANEACIPFALGISDTLQPMSVAAAERALCDARRRYIENPDAYEIVVVLAQDINTTAQNTLMQVRIDLGMRLQVFSAPVEMTFNPLTHVLVPRHRLLTAEEVRTLGLAPARLPTLRVSHRAAPRREAVAVRQADVVMKFLGAVDGDVVKVCRLNITSQVGAKRTMYRVCRLIDAEELDG